MTTQDDDLRFLAGVLCRFLVKDKHYWFIGDGRITIDATIPLTDDEMARLIWLVEDMS